MAGQGNCQEVVPLRTTEARRLEVTATIAKSAFADFVVTTLVVPLRTTEAWRLEVTATIAKSAFADFVVTTLVVPLRTTEARRLEVTATVTRADTADLVVTTLVVPLRTIEDVTTRSPEPAQAGFASVAAVSNRRATTPDPLPATGSHGYRCEGGLCRLPRACAGRLCNGCRRAASVYVPQT